MVPGLHGTVPEGVKADLGTKVAEEEESDMVAHLSTSQEFSSPFPIIVFEGLKVSLRPATRSNDWYSQPITSVTR